MARAIARGRLHTMTTRGDGVARPLLQLIYRLTETYVIFDIGPLGYCQLTPVKTKYSRTSRKRPPKMSSGGGRLRELRL